MGSDKITAGVNTIKQEKPCDYIPVDVEYGGSILSSEPEGIKPIFPMISVYRNKISKSSSALDASKTIRHADNSLQLSVDNNMRNKDLCKILIMLKDLEAQYSTKDESLKDMLKNIIVNFFLSIKSQKLLVISQKGKTN